MVKRFNQTVNTLDHIADLFVSNWGKLEPAGSNANGSWAFSTVAQRVLKQSLAVTTKRVFYEALVPLIYEQWVISPNYTGASDARWGGQALVLPGRTYRSWGDGDHPYPDPPKTPPFLR